MVFFVFREFINDISSSKENKMLISNFKYNYMVGNPMRDSDIETLIDNSLPIKSLENFSSIVHNQKGKKYNQKYYELFLNLQKPNITTTYAWNLIQSLGSSKTKRYLLKELFGTTTKKDLKSFKVRLNQKYIIKALLKSKLEAGIDEYFDLNVRAFIATGLLSKSSDYLHISSEFANIIKELGMNMVGKISSISNIFIKSISDLEIENDKPLSVKLIESRSKKFEFFLNEHLTYEKVIVFLNKMDKGDYSDISTFFSECSNNPTYAEFLVSVAFHYIAGRKTNFIESWNGTLSDDNMPMRYATGGKPDSAFILDGKSILVETTIQTGMQQATNEIAPISNHLNLETRNSNKIAYLFARNIFSETRRQLKIQRNSNNMIFGNTFLKLANILDKNSSFELSLEKLCKNV